MKRKILLIVLICNIFVPTVVLAHPGRTDSNGCHTCRTNCAKWGLKTGQYHCHNGGTSSSSSSNKSSSSSSSKNTTTKKPETKPVTKSTDNTLKSITINDETFTNFEENIKYETYDDSVEIATIPNDSKATVKINNKQLELGDNTISIEVTSESGSIKTYNLVITKLKLSDNTNMKLFILGEEIDFDNDKASINVPHDTEQIDYTYELEDQKSSVEIKNNNQLKDGENQIEFIVTAEDGTIKNYFLTINKEKSEIKNENNNEEKKSKLEEEQENNGFLYLLAGGSILLFVTGTIVLVLKATGKI